MRREDQSTSPTLGEPSTIPTSNRSAPREERATGVRLVSIRRCAEELSSERIMDWDERNPIACAGGLRQRYPEVPIKPHHRSPGTDPEGPGVVRQRSRSAYDFLRISSPSFASLAS
jgi:hypothetical protein